MSWGRVGPRFGACAVVGAVVLAASGTASASAGHAAISVGPLTRPHVNPLQGLGRAKNDTVTSTNWSGYAVQSASKFTDATGTWVQPTATCSSTGSQYAAFWVGIDGYSSSSVEQLGTDSDCTGRNKPSYYAWYEMYPANSVELSTSQYPVKPGDTLTADVSVSGTTFTLSLKSSRGWTFSTSASGSGLAQSSAEWIAESPEICSVFCRLASLSDFGTVNFTTADAAVSGGADQPLSAFTADGGPHEIVAESSTGTVRAQPSALSASGNAFSIAWKHS
jgi:Peptidase A4 family